MSLDPPTYLFSLQNNIRARPIPWDGAVRAGTVSDDQLSKIRAVDKVRKDQRQQIIEGDLDGYRTLFVGGAGTPSALESAARSAHVVQYILVLLGDLLEGRHILRHTEPRLTILNRSSSSIESSLGASRSLQTLPASPCAIERPRSPNTSSYIDRSREYDRWTSKHIR